MNRKQDQDTLHRREFLRAMGGGAVLLTSGAAVLAQEDTDRPKPRMERGAGKPGAPVTVAQRLAVLEAISRKANRLPRKDRAAENREMVRFLLLRPEFHEAGVTPDGCVLARFTDGRNYTFFNNYWPDREPAREEAGRTAAALAAPPLPAGRVRVADASAATGGAPVAFRSASAAVLRLLRGVTTAPLAPAPGGGSAGNLPGSLQVRVLNGVFSDTRGPISQAREWLLDRGYTAPIAGGVARATLENLAQVRGDGVFFLDTHGSPGSLSSTTQVSARMEQSPLVNEPLDNGVGGKQRAVSYSTVWITRDSGIFGTTTVYAIDWLFIGRRMRFAQDSLVWLCSCSGHSTMLQDGFRMAGASLIAAWDNTINGYTVDRALPFAIDRLLGHNTADPEEEPRQRPFDQGLVYADMDRRGLTRHTPLFGKGEARLHFTRLRDNFALLAPSIAWIDIDEQKGEFTVNGTFGADRGTVTVNDADILVKDWQPDKIVCALPAADAPGGAGPVIVRVRKIRSNVVPITVWRPTFKWTMEDKGTLRFRVDADLCLRADVHSHRNRPHEAPAGRVVPWVAAPRVSRYQYRADGSHTYEGNTITWNQDGLVPLQVNPRESTGVEDFRGSFDVTHRKMLLRMEGRVEEPEERSPYAREPSFGSWYFNKTKEYDEPVEIALDGDYNITAGQFVDKYPSLAYGKGYGDEIPYFSVPVRLEWETAAARFPPAPDAKDFGA